MTQMAAPKHPMHNGFFAGAKRCLAALVLGLSLSSWALFSCTKEAVREKPGAAPKSPAIEKDWVTIPRTEMEIAEMIDNLIGTTPETWKSDLPSYFGLDMRNNQRMFIIKYCAEKKCEPAEYSMFLIYEKTPQEICLEMAAQPLVNPKNNQYIGCEPAIDKSLRQKINPEK